MKPVNGSCQLMRYTQGVLNLVSYFTSEIVLRRKMGIIAKGLMANPTVVDLDLSCNILFDEGVKQVADVLKHENSVLGMLNLSSNHITAEGETATSPCHFLACLALYSLDSLDPVTAVGLATLMSDIHHADSKCSHSACRMSIFSRV